MDNDDVKKDERFKKVLNDPRYKAYKPVAQNVELDKRFENVLSQKRFAVDDDLFHKAESSSSDESSSDEEELDEIDSLDEWDREQKECYKEDCEETNRIAVCILDWDRITSTDLYVLINSFKPVEGAIRYVKVYASEFGKQRMAEERIKGPKELIDEPAGEQADDGRERRKMISSKRRNLDEDDEFNKHGFMKNKLRKYQINRLRYYYAVVELDSVRTAISVYEQLDGFEYLNSSVNLDLRFIPHDMQFDDELVNQCTALPDLNFYKAPDFINTALQQTKVRLTWEENNHDMSKKLVKAFEDIDNNKEVDYLDEYLASDTENEEDSLSDYDMAAGDSEGETKESKIEKYKNLLKSIEEEEAKSKEEKKKFDIEVDWTPAIDKHRRLDEDSDEEDEMDDDEKEAKRKQEQRNKYRKSKKFKKNKDESTSNAELELIAMDDKKEKKHFNYENYVENSKRVNKEKKKAKAAKDEFQFNSEDPRFSAIYDSPLYNIDPSNPKFKRTKAMSEVIQKKIRKH